MFAAIGPGPVEGDEGGDVLERRGRQRADERPHRPALELEHADGLAPLQQLVGLGVVERHVVDVELDAPGLRMTSIGVGDDVEVAQAEEVHLEQAQLLDAVHLVLGDDRRLLDGDLPFSGLRWMGRYSVSGSLVITTAAAWMPSWRRRPSRPLATSMTWRVSGSASYISRSSPAIL